MLWTNYWPAFGFPPEYAGKFFLFEGPFNPAGFLRSLRAIALNLASAALILAACQRAGEACRRFAGSRFPPAAFSLPAGVVVAGTAVLGLGTLGLLEPAVLGVFSAALLLAGGRPKLEWMPKTGLGVPVVVCLAAAVPAVFVALVPEVTYDALAYHVGAPEIYLKFHRIVRLEGMFFADLPGLVQMVYLPAVSLSGDAGSAKLMHYFFGAASMVLAGRLGKIVGGPKCADWSVLFLAATPFVWICMMRANVDLGVMFLVTAAVVQLVSVRGSAGAAAAGFFLGGAAAAKLTGGYALPAALAFMSKNAGKRFSGRRLGVFSLAAALPLLVWLLKAWFMTGNPVYPFGHEFMGGVGWSAENREAYRSDMTGQKSFNIQYSGVWGRLAGPWRMIMHDRGGEAALGIFVITLVPFFLLAGGAVSPPVRNIAWFCLVYWLAWFFTARDARFFLPAWPVACVMCARIWTFLLDSAGRLRPYLAAPFWLAAVFTPFFVSMLAWHLFNPGSVVWGTVGRGAYVDWMVPPQGKFAPMMRKAAEYFDEGERILIVGDVKVVDFKPIPVYASMFDTPQVVTWVREAGDARRLAVRFRQKGIDGVFFNPGGAVYLRSRFGHYRYTRSQYNVLKEFWTRRLKPVHELREKGVLELGLYRVLSRPSDGTGLPMPGIYEDNL